MVSSVWLSLLVINCVVPAWPALAHTNQEKFMQWLSAGGLDVGNLMLEISTFEGVRGLQAKRDIKQGDVMLRIPNSMVLTYETVLASDIKDVMVPLQKELPEKVLFALFILHEKGKGEKSKLAPYLSMFPEEINSLLSFTDEDLAHVRYRWARVLGKGIVNCLSIYII